MTNAWFLEIIYVRCRYVCVHVCMPPRLLITSGVIWNLHDTMHGTFCDNIDVHHQLLTKKSKVLYYTVISHNTITAKGILLAEVLEF